MIRQPLTADRAPTGGAASSAHGHARSPSSSFRVAAAFLVAVALLLTQMPLAAASTGADLEPTIDLQEIRSSGNQNKGRWQSFEIDVPWDATIRITADWKGSGDVNLYLLDGSGKNLAHANSRTAKPEVINYAAKAGSYTLNVLVATGSANYTVQVQATPAPPVAVFRSIGDQQTGRFQSFAFNLPSRRSVTVIADWIGDADVNIYLRDAAGTTVRYANSTSAKPEALTYDAPPGDYQLNVLVASGRASYVAEVHPGPHVPTATVNEPAPLPPLSPRVTPQYPGQPAAGSVAWGSTTPTVARMQDNESAAGVSLALRRTFWRWDQRLGGLVTTAAGDHAAGRLPWVSVKTPPWADMAAGKHDAEIDQLLGALDALDGPVWLTVHHEPEGDDPAGPAGHRGMNQRVRQRMNALGVDNVALAPILMAWTFDPRSGRDINDWWAPGVYDFLGIDIYRDTEASLITPTWLQIRSWAAAQGIDVAVGEWGMRGTDAAAGQRVRDWYDHAANSHTDDRGARVVGLSAFDSGANSPTGSWQLHGEQHTAFLELLNDPRTARPACNRDNVAALIPARQ